MKCVPVNQAVGMILCHDITEIIPGVHKKPAFKKGHVVKLSDIEHLLRLGKEHLYIWETDESKLHENDAAVRMATAISGKGISFGAPSEGKVELKADYDGLLKIKTDFLFETNSIDEIVIATIHSNQLVKTGDILAGCRVVPLIVDKEKIEQVEEIAKKASAMFEVLPLKSKKVGIVTTGSEVYSGRITDKFGPVIRKKFEALGSAVIKQVIVDDDEVQIAKAIHDLIDLGAEIVVTTGGMSVDPDDVTPTGIKLAGGEVISYGAPVLPGSMFMLAQLGEVTVMGLPGCVMYNKATIFDLVLPRVLAQERLTHKDLVAYGHGGLCMHCKECTFPKCTFGKGN